MKLKMLILGCLAFTQALSAQINPKAWDEGLAIVAQQANLVSLQSLTNKDDKAKAKPIIEKLKTQSFANVSAVRAVLSGFTTSQHLLCDNITNLSQGKEFNTPDEAKEYLAKQLLKDPVFSSCSFAKDPSKMKALSASIAKKLDGITDWVPQQTDVAGAGSSHTQDTSKDNASFGENLPSFSIPSPALFIAIISLVLAAAAVFALFLQNRKQQALEEELRHHRDKQKDDLNKYRDDLNTLNRRCDGLVQQLAAAKAEIEQLKARPVAPAPAPAAKPTPPKPAPVKQIFFLSAPNGNAFSSTSKKYLAGESIYQLETFDGKKGDFFLINNRDVLDTVRSSASAYIKPACKSEEELSQDTRTILTEKPGLALFEDGQWKITEKAIVRYE
jgi:hypothetical protein